MKKGIVLIGVAALLIIIGMVLLGKDGAGLSTKVAVDVGDPSDPAIEFYKDWLDAVHSTTTNPVEAGLVNSEVLAESVREYIRVAQADPELVIDPVLCQTITPKRVGTKVSYLLDTKAQVLIIARGGEVKSSELAVVDLIVVDDKWQINKISCSAGETAPVREFSFDHEGFLLKSALQPPLNSEYWHLVFEENGENGHTAPLFFNAESECTKFDGTVVICDETKFAEATKSRIQGEMTEAGVSVSRATF